jgi:hypothetical protein
MLNGVLTMLIERVRGNCALEMLRAAARRPSIT